jgi:hypothetical protein
VEAKAIGTADDLLDRQCCAAPGVAVELGEDDPVELERGVEGLGDADGVLSGHGVDDEERVVRLDLGGDPPDLVHQLRVDRETAGRVDDEDVPTEAPGLRDRPACDVDRVALAGGDDVVGRGVHRHVDLAPERPQLLDRGGRCRSAPTISGFRPWVRNHRASLAEFVVLPEPWRPAMSTTVGRLRRVGDAQGLAAEGLGELLEDDLLDLQRGVERPRELLAHGTVADAALHRLDDRQVDVGLEQRQADLAEHLVDVGLGQPALAAQAGEDAVETVAE